MNSRADADGRGYAADPGNRSTTIDARSCPSHSPTSRASASDASGAYPFPVFVADLLVGEHVVDDQLGVRQRPGRRHRPDEAAAGVRLPRAAGGGGPPDADPLNEDHPAQVYPERAAVASR